MNTISLTLQIQIEIAARNELSYEKKRNRLISKLEKMGFNVDVENEDEADYEEGDRGSFMSNIQKPRTPEEFRGMMVEFESHCRKCGQNMNFHLILIHDYGSFVQRCQCGEFVAAVFNRTKEGDKETYTLEVSQP